MLDAVSWSVQKTARASKPGFRTKFRVTQLRSFCDAEDFDDDAFGALAVELGVEDALPRAEIEAAARDRQSRLVVEQQGFEVRVGVVFAGLVVLVAGP